MKNDFIYEEMCQKEADGVDFVPIVFNFHDLSALKVYESYTKEQWLKVNCFPKTNRVYWKLVEGKKQYV